MHDELIDRRLSRRMNRMATDAGDAAGDVRVLCLQQAHFDLDTIDRHMHRHTFHEVHFSLCGTAVYDTEDGPVTVREGEYLFLPSGLLHTLRSFDAGHVRDSLAFLPVGQDGTGLSFPSVCRYGQTDAMMAQALGLAIGAAKQEDGVGPLLLQHAGEALALLFAEERAARTAREKEDVRLTQARQFIRDNRTRPITVAEVAGSLHLSERQLNRLFLTGDGRPVGAAIRAARCEAIKERLAADDRLIADIAEELGFPDEFNLIRFFTKIEGMPPGRYRKGRKG